MNRRSLFQLAGAALISGAEATRAYSFLNGFGFDLREADRRRIDAVLASTRLETGIRMRGFIEVTLHTALNQVVCVTSIPGSYLFTER